MHSGAAPGRDVRVRRARGGSFVRATRYGINEQVHTHADRGLVKRWWIVVRPGILPTVSKVALVAVEQRQSIANEDPEATSRFAIVLVNLRKSGGKVVYDMIDRVRERHIHQGTIRKNSRDFLTEALVQAVVVIDVEKAAAIEVLAKSHHLGIRKLDDAVAGDVEERMVPESIVLEADASFRRLDLQARSFA